MNFHKVLARVQLVTCNSGLGVQADPEQVDLKKKQVAYYKQLQAIDMQRVNYYKDQEAALTLS